MKLKLPMLLLLFTATVASAQVEQVTWINNNAIPLRQGPDTDLNFLSEELNGKTVVGLGEASHGTREFYLEKGRIIQYLVTRESFRDLAIEFPDSLILPINQYLMTGRGNLRELMDPMALYKTEEILDLFEWIWQFNRKREITDRVAVLGIDREEYRGNPFTRDEFMAGNMIRNYESKNRKTVVWAHNVHIAKDTTMAQFPGLGYHLTKRLGDKFYVIGFDTFQGTVNVLNNGVFEMHPFAGKENTLSAMFAGASDESFFLSFTKRPNPFTGTTGLITNIYSNWQPLRPLPVRPGVDFDAIIFIRNTTASVQLGRK